MDTKMIWPFTLFKTVERKRAPVRQQRARPVPLPADPESLRVGEPLPADASTAAIFFCFHDLFGIDAGCNKTPFVHSITITAGPNKTGTDKVRITADAPFVAFSLMAICTHPDEFTSVGIRSDTTDRALFWNLPTQLLGTPSHPLVLPSPLRLQANSVLSFDFYNACHTEATVTIGIIGYKVYRGTSTPGYQHRQGPKLSLAGIERLKSFLDSLSSQL